MKNPQSLLDDSTVAGRIRLLLNKVWLGSQTAMARDVRVRPGSISNVVTGKRKPGRAIIAAISAHPLVNVRWLLHGTGSPLRTDDDPTEAALPVASRPFAGSPQENPDVLPGELYAVPRRLARPSRYWLRMDIGHPLTRDADLKIAVGDFVLFESDREGWPKDLTRKPCLLACVIDGATTFRFARCNVSCPSGVDDFSVLDVLHAANAPATCNRELRNIQLDETSTTADQSKPSASATKPSIRIEAVAIFRCGDFQPNR